MTAWKRRRVLRDSEEPSGSISLERYILASDPSRSTSLTDPPPYPLSVTFSLELTTVLRPFYIEAREILRNHGFPSSVTLEADIFCKPGYPGWDPEMNLLRVVVKGTQHTQLRFGPANDKVMKLLKDKGTMDINVDIVNTELYHVPFFFPG
ncbi:hypothetical protein N7513_007370 [Penicillium frequentans]|nr:hypothetical protein N7513_007370 [Penicillium glabrum]